MKAIPLFGLLLVICLVPSLHAQGENPKRIENGGVSVEVPPDWGSQAVNDPIMLLAVDSKNTSTAIVVREVKADMGVKDLQEYFDFKLEKIAGAWEDTKLGDAKSAAGENKVLWKEGTATLIDPKKIKIPSNVIIATAEGKEYYYLILLSERTKTATDGGAQLRKILDSLKAE